MRGPPAAETGGQRTHKEIGEPPSAATIASSQSGNNAGPWFEAVRADHRLPVSAVSVARVIQDGVPRSAVELAEATGYSLRCIPLAVRALAARGHVVVIKGGGRGRKTRLLPIIRGGAE